MHPTEILTNLWKADCFFSQDLESKKSFAVFIIQRGSEYHSPKIWIHMKTGLTISDVKYPYYLKARYCGLVFHSISQDVYVTSLSVLGYSTSAISNKPTNNPSILFLGIHCQLFKNSFNMDIYLIGKTFILTLILDIDIGITGLRLEQTV